MSFYNGAVDQIQTVARFRSELVENTLPDPTSRCDRLLARSFGPSVAAVEKRPVLIAQIKSHDPPPRRVTYVRPNYSIVYLGTDSNTCSTE